jgi:multiple sugar transport system substrate-binding protein
MALSTRVTRRRLLAAMGGLSAVALLAACGAPAAPTATPAPAAKPAAGAAPTAAPAAKPAAGAAPTAAPAAGAAPAPAASKPATGAPIPMRLHVRAGPEEDLWPAIVPKFEQENNVKFELIQVPGAEHVQKIQTMVAGGQLGDVIHIFTGDSSFQMFFSSGVLIGLDPFIQKDNYDMNQYYKFCADICKIDGKYGGLPFKGHPSRVGVFYNKDVFDAAGVPVPTNDMTYEQLAEAAKKLHKQSGQDVQMYGWSNPAKDPEWYILMSRMGGGDLYSDNGTKANLNNPDSQWGWAWTYDRMNKDKVMLNPIGANPTVNDLFLSGKLAFHRANVGTKAAFANIDKFQWGMSLAPKGPKGQRGSLAQADVVGVTQFSKVPELSWAFIKLMTNKESGIILGKQTGAKSATPGGRPDVYESPELLNLKMPPGVQENTMIAMKEAEPFTQPANYRGPEIQRAIDPLYESLLLDKHKPDKEFFGQLNQAVQDILDKPKP